MGQMRMQLWPGKRRAKRAAEADAKQATLKSYMVSPGQPVWTRREYADLAEEAYRRNVVAYRAVNMIAQSAASVTWGLMDRKRQVRLQDHALLALLAEPNPSMDCSSLIETLVSHKLISGNAYLLAVGPQDSAPLELLALRPDRVQAIAGEKADGLPHAYRYHYQQGYHDYPVNPVTGKSPVLHWRNFHPLNDYYGMSPVEAAAYSIDQHNQAGAWNQALLQNGARPSGALVVKATEANSGGTLSENQYSRLKEQIQDQFVGSTNAGRPLLLEGGLDWREMSISPKDMDFIETKHSSARDIALAFGVPPQLLGIPGDNTYANLAEARLALWEQTILPLLDHLERALNRWLVPQFEEGGRLTLQVDRDRISALTPRRDAYWERINRASFLSDAEKRELLGVQKGE